MSRTDAYREATALYCAAVEKYGRTMGDLGRGAYHATTADSEKVHRRILAIANFLAGESHDQPSSQQPAHPEPTADPTG